MQKFSPFSTSLSALVVCWFIMIAVLTGVRWYLLVVLIFISLMISDIEHLSFCLLAICVYFLVVSFQVPSPFFNWNVCQCWVLKILYSPGCCSSVDWVPAYKPKGRWFHSQSGHMSELQARSPVRGAWETTAHWCFSPSLSPSLPLCLKINKIF